MVSNLEQVLCFHANEDHAKEVARMANASGMKRTAKFWPGSFRVETIPGYWPFAVVGDLMPSHAALKQ